MMLRLSWIIVIAAAAFCFLTPAVDAEPIDTCGFIESVLGCKFFHPLSGEPVDYLIEIDAVPDSLQFTPLRVVGSLVPCQKYCDDFQSTTCIVDYEISACPSEDLGCGVLSGPYYDDYCWLWSSPTYGMLLTGLHGFSVGDTVHVTGIPDYSCVTICSVGTGCLWEEVFSACPDSNSATQRVSWGKLKNLFRR